MRLPGLLIAAALLWPMAAGAAAADAVADIGAFRFEDGGQIPAMHVGYNVQGHLDSTRRNAILLLPPTSGDRHTYDSLIGPGKPFDPDRYLVISVDPIGGGLSSKPADGLGSRFPQYTIRDMVSAEARLVHDVLKIDRLHAIVGASMGSFQAIEWAIEEPVATDRLILVAPAARSDAHFRSIVAGMDAILASPDGAWTDPRRMHAAAALFMPWLRSDAYLVRRGEGANRDEVEALGKNWSRNWDTLSLLYRYHASAGHDVGVPFGNDVSSALARIKASTLIVSISSDRTVPPYLTAELRAGIAKVREVTVETDGGHSAFLAPGGSADSAAIWHPVAQFLQIADPT